MITLRHDDVGLESSFPKGLRVMHYGSKGTTLGYYNCLIMLKSGKYDKRFSRGQGLNVTFEWPEGFPKPRLQPKLNQHIYFEDSLNAIFSEAVQHLKKSTLRLLREDFMNRLDLRNAQRSSSFCIIDASQRFAVTGFTVESSNISMRVVLGYNFESRKFLARAGDVEPKVFDGASWFGASDPIITAFRRKLIGVDPWAMG